MLRRLRIENFMAHEDTRIEFAPGVTVITGPNNTGKSAVVEALRCVVTNPSPRHFIRHGAKQARVELELADGTLVAWVRKERYALYEVLRPGEDEPETYAKFGRTPPEDVLALLGLSPVVVEEANGAEVDVHLGDQREPIFLLNRSGTVMAGFFAASSEAAHLLSMQQLLRTRVLRSRQEKNALEERIERIDIGLDRLAPLPGLELALESGRTLAASVASAQRQLPELESLARRLRSDRVALQGVRTNLDILRPLRPVPPLADTATLAALFTTGARLRAASARARGELDALAPLAVPPRSRETRDLSVTTQSLRRLGRTRATAAMLSQILAPLTAPAPAHPTAGMADMIASLRTLAGRRAPLARAQQTLAALTEPPVAASTVELAALSASLRHAAQQIRQARAAVQAMGQELTAGRAQIESRLVQIGACPLCGGTLDAASFLNGDHVHEISNDSVGGDAHEPAGN